MLKKYLILTGVLCSLMGSCITTSAMEKENKKFTIPDPEDAKHVIINSLDDLDNLPPNTFFKMKDDTPTGDDPDKEKKVVDTLREIEKSLFGMDEINYYNKTNEEKKDAMSILDTNMKSLISLEKYIYENNLTYMLDKNYGRKIQFRINWQKKKIERIRNHIMCSYLNYVKKHSGENFGIIPFKILDIFREKEKEIFDRYNEIKEKLEYDSTYFTSEQKTKDLENLLNIIKEVKEDDRYIFAGNYGEKDGKNRRDRINKIEDEMKNLIVNPNIK